MNKEQRHSLVLTLIFHCRFYETKVRKKIYFRQGLEDT